MQISWYFPLNMQFLRTRTFSFVMCNDVYFPLGELPFPRGIKGQDFEKSDHGSSQNTSMSSIYQNCAIEVKVLYSACDKEACFRMHLTEFYIFMNRIIKYVILLNLLDVLCKARQSSLSFTCKLLGTVIISKFDQRNK